jgi:hypothetical protein
MNRNKGVGIYIGFGVSPPKIKREQKIENDKRIG